MMMSIAANLQQVQQRIAAAKQQYGRVTDTVKLLAASKQQSVDAIRTAYLAGQNIFGENYLQEALTKQQALQDLALEWHFSGHIQTNKAALIAQHFAWVHTISSIKQAQKLHQARPAHLPPLNCCIQINISAEESKQGISPSELFSLVDAIAILPNLRLRGLMAIPAPTREFEQQRQQCHALHRVYLELQQSYPALDTLSMGMSHDLEAAVAEGSTLVRVGTAIFGQRGF